MLFLLHCTHFQMKLFLVTTACGDYPILYKKTFYVFLTIKDAVMSQKGYMHSKITDNNLNLLAACLSVSYQTCKRNNKLNKAFPLEGCKQRGKCDALLDKHERLWTPLESVMTNNIRIWVQNGL